MGNQRRHHDLRIGTPEREAAMTLLGEHLGAGRIDTAEYEQRCSCAAAARYGSEVAPLFDDLPAPHPEYQPASESDPGTRRRSTSPAGRILFVVCLVVLVVLLAVMAKKTWLLGLLALALIALFRRRRA